MTTYSIRTAAQRPLGIPPQFILDQLQRGRSTSQFALLPLLREYEDAAGHTFAWGQLIEQRTCGQTIWRIMPLALWDSLEQDREGSALTIRELTAALHAVVREFLAPHIPPQLVLTGCQSRKRLSAHSLFALLCPTDRDLEAARSWLETHFLPHLLPHLFDACQAHLGMLLAVSLSRTASARDLVRTLTEAAETAP